jgi:hypothetical protein
VVSLRVFGGGGGGGEVREVGKREAKKEKKIELSRSLFLPSSLPPENSLQELALDLVDGLVAGLEGDGVDSQRHRRRERRFFL